MTTFRYVATIEDGVGARYRVAGTVETHFVDFAEAANEALLSAYRRMTNGETTYGRPGEGGCKGPYKVLILELARTPHEGA